MNSQPITKDTSPNNLAFGHAVVIGSSIAGLTAARVLIDYFTQVTIVERDHLPDAPHSGGEIPQAQHAHVLHPADQKTLEQQFPGLVDELVASGAELVNPGLEAEFFLSGAGRAPRSNSRIVSVAGSRPLLENTIYRRLVTHPGVIALQGYEAVGLQVDEPGERVSGVRLRNRDTLDSDEMVLAADLVVDASGRSSQAPQWLANLGVLLVIGQKTTLRHICSNRN